MRRIVGPVEIEHQVGGDAVPFPLAQVNLPEYLGQAIAGPGTDGILQPGERRLAGKIGVGQRQAATDVLEQRVGAQRGCVILVLVPAGDLVDALGHQGPQVVPAATAAPVGDLRGQPLRQPHGGVSLGQPGQPAITGQASAQEVDLQGRRADGGKGDGSCGRLRHTGHSL
ncbi:MAG: hypothetical protein M3452_08385 [Chloroflexota bacterium]|nr:hypothetical protein [Chloroflexota bacterium]